jgi:2-oxoglutarate ferredoxin oxidoreductase subunit beta
VLKLHKLAPDYDPGDRLGALTHLQELQAAGEIVTGLLYVDPQAEDLHVRLDTVEMPLNRLTEAELCPGAAALDRINAALR